MKDNYDEMSEALNNPDKVYGDFVEKGYYSINISRKFIGNLKTLFIQNDRMLKLRNKSHKSISSNHIYFAYMFWVDVVYSEFTPKAKEFLVIKYFSKLFWHQIKSIKREDVDESTVRIIFYPRT